MTIRSGKTFLLVLLFLMELKKVERKQVIIVGATMSAVRRNILSMIEMWTGQSVRLGKSSEFTLFGNTVYCFGGDSADSYKSIRGFTSSLTLISEATTLHEDTVKECIDRTSGEGAKILSDTNPSNPFHFFKTEFIDKAGARDCSGKLQIMGVHFSMLENTTLPQDYIDRQLLLYEKGTADYDRNIMGAWTAKEGVIYTMFDENKHMIDAMPCDDGVVKYFAGVDWGYDHHGSIVVVAKMRSGKFIVVEEVAERNRDFDWWKAKAKELHERYNIHTFYCDSARPEYVQGLASSGLNAVNGNKSVLAGITKVCQVLTEERLLFIKGKFVKGCAEMYQYVWKGGDKEEPVKKHDDVLDGLRYAIYSESKKEEVTTMYTGFTGAKNGYDKKIKSF